MTGGKAPSYQAIAQAVIDTAARPLPAETAPAARRTLFTVLTVARGAAGSPEVPRLAHVFTARCGVPAGPGGAGYATAANAALLTGFAAHLNDFDDPHLATVIHPGAAVLGAAWSA